MADLAFSFCFTTSLCMGLSGMLALGWAFGLDVGAAGVVFAVG